MNNQVINHKCLKILDLKKDVKGLLYYDPKDKSLEKVINIYKLGYKKVSLFFSDDLSKIKLVLLYQRAEMDLLMHSNTPGWVVGYSNTNKKDSIYIFSPLVFDKVSPHSQEAFGGVLIHEMAHLFIRQIHKSYEPLWLEEGLAGFVAGQIRLPQKGSINTNIKGVIFSLDTGINWQKAAMEEKTDPYSISQLIVRFLIKKYGKDKLLKLIKLLKGKYQPEKFVYIMEKVYGETITKDLDNKLVF